MRMKWKVIMLLLLVLLRRAIVQLMGKERIRTEQALVRLQVILMGKVDCSVELFRCT